MTSEPVMVITKFPELTVEVSGSENLEFTEADEVPTSAGLQTQLHTLATKTMEERDKFCKGRPWWDCSEQATQKECAFVEGQCKGAPVEIEPERYYEKWKRIYAPIYENMRKPNIDAYGRLIVSHTSIRRKKSIRRERVMV